jgi:hypothetical protein
VTLDNTLVPESTLFNIWDDGPGVCLPVATEEASWGTVKGMYR